MQLTTIISATLGLSKPWRITDVVFSADRKRLDVTVEFDQFEHCTCPNCGMPGNIADYETATWFNNDFFHYQTYLHSQVPRIKCCHNIFNVEPPWSKGSRFVILQ